MQMQVFKTVWDVRLLFANPVDISLFLVWLVTAVLLVRSAIRKAQAPEQGVVDMVAMALMGVVGVLSLIWILLQYLEYVLHWGVLYGVLAVGEALLSVFFGWTRGFH